MSASSNEQSMEMRHQRAVETWERFDQAISNELLRAVSGAFALVACADGNLEESEIEAFLDMVRDVGAFKNVDMSSLEGHFRSIGQAILDDFEDGRRHALQEIALVEKDEPDQSALVVSAAQIAVVSNGRLDQSEETVLAEICRALGLDPAAY